MAVQKHWPNNYNDQKMKFPKITKNPKDDITGSAASDATLCHQLIALE